MQAWRRSVLRPPTPDLARSYLDIYRFFARRYAFPPTATPTAASPLNSVLSATALGRRPLSLRRPLPPPTLSQRAFHTSTFRRELDRRLPPENSLAAVESKAKDGGVNVGESAKETKAEDQAVDHHHQRYLSQLPEYFRGLVQRLPAIKGRRPTKDDLLALPLTFFERLRIRIKWFTIRGFRRYTSDDWSAFVSWIVGGVGAWVVLGTTSFAAVIFLLLNSLQLQESMARALGDYLTSSSGITVVFESAIVPKFNFRDSRISFKNVFISRGEVREDMKEHWTKLGWLGRGDVGGPKPKGVVKRILGKFTGLKADASEGLPEGSGQSEDVKDLVQTEVGGANVGAVPRGATAVEEETLSADGEQDRYTHFHLNVDTIDVSLSFWRWLDGKGLVESAVVKGVRGVIDRSHIEYQETDPEAPVDRKTFRHTAHSGDFHLEALTVEDFLVTVYQPNNFRPYILSVFDATVTTLRKQWLFFDLLSAERITGQIDNCLFSLHRPQSISRTSAAELELTRPSTSSSTSLSASAAAEAELLAPWKRMSRFRVDGVPIDHLKPTSSTGQSTSSPTSPIEWIQSGRCDLVADIRFPREPGDDVDFNAILSDIVDRVGEVVIGGVAGVGMEDRLPGRQGLAKPALEAPRETRGLGVVLWERDGEKDVERELKRFVDIDLDIRFKDVKATVPMFNTNLSYTNYALVRPIVAFINANRTLIPVKCHVEMDLSEFDGSWTFYDTGLLDQIGDQVYAALAHHVQSQSENSKRFKTVGVWSLQVTANAVLHAFRDHLPMH